MEKEITLHKNISSYPKFEENPFITGAIEKVRENTVTKKQFIKGDKGVENLIVNQDGEITGMSAFMRIVEVDEDKFAKLYLSQLAVLWDLPNSAIKVFSYILNGLKPNNDSIYFKLQKCMEYTGYKSHPSVHQGLSALIDVGIIARSEDENWYFINPLIVFNGNRVSFVKTYVKKKKGEGLNPNQISLLDQPGV
jgi:hypothetical protein